MKIITEVNPRAMGHLHLALSDGSDVLLTRGSHEEQNYQVGDTFPKVIEPAKPVAELLEDFTDHVKDHIAAKADANVQETTEATEVDDEDGHPAGTEK